MSQSRLKASYETAFEDIVKGRADLAISLISTYYPSRPLLNQKKDVRFQTLRLVDRNYRYWWVVEVEMAHHSLLWPR